MKRILIILTLAFAAPAQADDIRDRIVSELRSDGFTEIRISRTWLGRIRLVGESADEVREIVVNPVTGVILRDYSKRLRLRDDDEDDQDDDDERDDDDDDDDDGDDGDDDGDDE